MTPPFKAKPYDSARVTVALQGGFTFAFDVQDWEDDKTNLDDGRAFAMADDLARSGVELFGVLSLPVAPVAGLSGTNWPAGWTRLDPAQIVAVLITPTGKAKS